MSIIIKDLDIRIIEYCDLETDYKNLLYVNKNYSNLIMMNNLFDEWRK